MERLLNTQSSYSHGRLFSDDRLDAISVLAAIFGLVALYGIAVGIINTNAIIAQKAALGAGFLAVGFAPAVAITEMNRAWVPNLFSNIRFSSSLIIFGLVAFGLILISQVAVTSAIGALGIEDVLGSKAFYASMAVAEEFLFGYLILNLITLFTGVFRWLSGLVANIIDSTIFMFFHFAVYGSLGQYVPLTNYLSVYLNSALAAVWISRFILNFIYQSSKFFLGHKYIAITIIPHTLLDFILAGPSSSVTISNGSLAIGTVIHGTTMTFPAAVLVALATTTAFLVIKRRRANVGT